MPKTAEFLGHNREQLKRYILTTLVNISLKWVLLSIEAIIPDNIASIVMQYVDTRVQLPDSEPWNYKELAKQNSLCLQEYLLMHGYNEYTSRVVKLYYELGYHLNQDTASLVFEYLGDKNNKDFSKSFKGNFSRIQLVNEMFYTYKGFRHYRRGHDVIDGCELDLPLRLAGGTCS